MNQITRVISSSLVRFQDFADGLQTQSAILADHDQFIVWANQAALRLHGVDQLEQLGATVSEYMSNFRLDYIDPLSATMGRSIGRDVGLYEGMLDLARPGDVHESVRCRMQLFEITDPVRSTCSTAMILQPEEAWPDEAAYSRGDRPDALDVPAPQMRVMARALDTRRPVFAPERNSVWRSPSQTDIAATLHREMIARARTICAAVPIALHVLDAGMRILCVSDAWLSWLGYNAASVIGRDIGLFMDPETRIRFEQQAWARLQETGATENVLCRFVKRTGETVEAIVAASPDVDEAGELAYTTCVPVELANHQHDDGLMRLMTQSPVPTLCWQLDDSSVREANQPFYALTGHPAGSGVGQNVDGLGLWETKAARQKLEQELGMSGVLQRQDVRLRTSKGEMLTCAVSATLVRLSGHPCGVLMLQDVTDRRRDEAQLFEAIEAVMKDSAWFSRTVIEKLATLRSPPKPSGRHAELAELTRREREVLTLISVGQCDLDIARQLGLTRSTVRNHVATLYSKIDVHSRSAAIVWARERGINLTVSRTAPKDSGRAASL